MNTDPGKEIQSLFAQASLQHDRARNLNGEEMAAYRKIQENHAAQARFEERQFELEYQTRFEVARKRIIDEGGAKDRKFAPRWFGSDKFDAAAINRQADRDVRHAHADLLAELTARRNEALQSLFLACGERRGTREKLKSDFSKAAGRRSGEERRRGPIR